jgi:16S rRNA (adenine1518-N6/adenine1519-N6)-dimethyltransferase
MTTSRQTLKFLMQRFSEAGVRLNPRFGQNFLVDLNLVEFLAREAELGPNDVVLEVGTGTGSLTGIMAESAAWVVSVEIDRQMHQLASEHLIDSENITLLHQDALSGKHTIAPEVRAVIAEQLAAAPGRQFKLAANLPYNIATPLIANLLATEPIPVTMTVTIQKELADRIIAPPSTKDRSALSVWVQSQADSTILRVLPPDVFFPRPKVHSAILRIVTRPERRATLGDVGFFHEFVKSIFLHRRKFLRGSVVSAYGNQLSKTEIDAVLGQFEFSPTVRAETLEVPQLAALADAMRRALQAKAAESAKA